MTPDNTSSASDKLLKAAQVLFYNYGVTATGIDALVKQAGVEGNNHYVLQAAEMARMLTEAL